MGKEKKDKMAKRIRSPNLLKSEKEVLMDLVQEHFRIIENKKTDAVSVQEKNDEWDKIATGFNATSLVYHRTAENLKSAWENLKKTAKKAGAAQKGEIFKTGKEIISDDDSFKDGN